MIADLSRRIMEILYWGRTIERLLVVGAGASALFMGYKLFALTVVEQQSAEISAGGWIVKLRKVGPGVFFALFGTIIIFGSWSAPLKLDGVGGVGLIVAEKTGGLSYATSPTALRDAVTILNSVVELTESQDDSITSAIVTDLRRSRGGIVHLREQLVVSVLGRDAVKYWKENQESFVQHPQNLPIEDRERLRAIAPWFTETLAEKDLE